VRDRTTPVGVGVLGTGAIGSDHARRLARRVHGARLVAVFDLDAERAGMVRGETGARVHATAAELIGDDEVEAVVVASPDATHADLAAACIAAGKPSLCEKPAGSTAAEARRLLDAEVSGGRRLVQLGFMRRFDAGYLAVKGALDAGSIGVALLVHCVHRGRQAPEGWTSEMQFTNSAVHELDLTRWLLGEEIVAVLVPAMRRSPLAAPGLRDPLLVLLETSSGCIVEVELFVNCRYGYDVRCEVVGTTGTVSLESPAEVAVAHDGTRRRAVAADWRERFGQAYLDELQFWVDGVAAGEPGGPSVWDGYRATAVAEACVRSMHGGVRIEVPQAQRPALYARDAPVS
jgi:myo-inositol 2-dehydrogenase/D-chiro-inositol 1-dehydrogenase